MRYWHFLISIVLLWGLLCGVACTSKSDNAAAISTLNGYWTLETAMRNDQQTALLDGTWMEFIPDKSIFRTNLQIVPNETPYSADKSLIHIKSQPPIDFKIMDSNDSVLQISFEMRSQIFVLAMKKAEKPIETDDFIKPNSDSTVEKSTTLQ